jgi:hypothetical protein
MFGSLGVSVSGLALTLVVLMIITRIWRSRRSPQLPEVLRSGLVPGKKFRPVLKRKLLQIEEALPYLMSKKFAAKISAPVGPGRLPQPVDLQARLEQAESQCAQLMQRNAELSRALARAELLRQNMCEIANAAIRSAGVAIEADRYVSLPPDDREQSVGVSGDQHELSYSALKANECSQTS